MRGYAGPAAGCLAVLTVALVLPAAATARPAPAAAPRPAAARPVAGGISRAACDVRRRGSAVVADCHNPDPQVVRIRLHVTCVRWWDPATDTAPVDDGPAQWVRLTGRCWKEVRAVWLTREVL